MSARVHVNAAFHQGSAESTDNSMSFRSTTNNSFKTSDGMEISFKRYPAQTEGACRLALIHPLALNRTIWNRVINILAGRAEVLTYDCRGHGDSERKPMQFTTDMFARDLAELLDRVGWENASVAGCSLGGCVAQAFAAKYPGRLKALGLIDTTSWYGPEAPEKWRSRVVTARANGLTEMLDFQLPRWFSDDFRVRSPEVVENVSAIFAANDIDCYCEACTMLGEADLRPLLPSIHVPTMITVGQEDYATPVAMSQRLHESIPGSTLRILPHVRHLTPLEAPEAIAAELLELLGRIA